MTGMIVMPPPPEPPDLEPDKIRALIDYADKMAEYTAAEMEMIHALGQSGSSSIKYLGGLVEGWKFTAQGLRDSYDGQF